MSQDSKQESFFIAPEQEESSVTTSEQTKSDKNHSWNVIARLNWIAMVISLLLVFGLDLTIIIGDSSLAGFWFIMIGVLGVFAGFFYVENYVFKKTLIQTNSKIDAAFIGLVLLRNITFILNFIPFIQILGMIIAAAAVIPYIIIYLIAVWFRMKKVKNVTA